VELQVTVRPHRKSEITTLPNVFAQRTLDENWSFTTHWSFTTQSTEAGTEPIGMRWREQAVLEQRSLLDGMSAWKLSRAVVRWLEGT
jgi:hypothetical protein